MHNYSEKLSYKPKRFFCLGAQIETFSSFVFLTTKETFIYSVWLIRNKESDHKLQEEDKEINDRTLAKSASNVIKNLYLYYHL